MSRHDTRSPQTQTLPRTKAMLDNGYFALQIIRSNSPTGAVSTPSDTPKAVSFPFGGYSYLSRSAFSQRSICPQFHGHQVSLEFSCSATRLVCSLAFVYDAVHHVRRTASSRQGVRHETFLRIRAIRAISCLASHPDCSCFDVLGFSPNAYQQLFQLHPIRWCVGWLLVPSDRCYDDGSRRWHSDHYWQFLRSDWPTLPTNHPFFHYWMSGVVPFTMHYNTARVTL